MVIESVLSQKYLCFKMKFQKNKCPGFKCFHSSFLMIFFFSFLHCCNAFIQTFYRTCPSRLYNQTKACCNFLTLSFLDILCWNWSLCECSFDKDLADLQHLPIRFDHLDAVSSDCRVTHKSVYNTTCLVES